MGESLGPVWNATVRRIAVAAAAGLALVSLVHDLPVRVAALRGGMLLVALLAVARVSGALLARLDAERRKGVRA